NRPDAGTFDVAIQRAIFGQKVCSFRVFDIAIFWTTTCDCSRTLPQGGGCAAPKKCPGCGGGRAGASRERVKGLVQSDARCRGTIVRKFFYATAALSVLLATLMAANAASRANSYGPSKRGLLKHPDQSFAQTLRIAFSVFRDLD